MTFDQLQEANKQIVTTDVKGKAYAEVNQRIKAFRMLHPNGTIETEIVSLANDICVIKASVYDEESNLLGTGHAYEQEGSTFINKTSYIENCETSAVGRALGMCGIGIDTAVCSYEEVTNTIHQQEVGKIEKMLISDIKVKALLERCKNDLVPAERICTLYKVKSFAELTEKQYRNIADNWSKIGAMQ